MERSTVLRLFALVLSQSSIVLAQDQPAFIVVTAPAEREDTAGLDADDVRGVGRPDMLRALTRAKAGVSLQDAQGNPFQPNLVYRGFTISPLQGQAQGLAAYVDGARFNQPFGDTVQFDLLPQVAIERIDLTGTNPAYGLNALGGALVVATKTGRSAPGTTASMSAGSFGELAGFAEQGWAGERTSAYAALQLQREDGWRRFSLSQLTNAYADLGVDGAAAGTHLKLVGASGDLTGNGSAPVELLEVDRRAVFTHPDRTRNRYARVSLHPWAEIGPHMRVEASFYWQYLRQRTRNGDTADIEACGDAARAGLLCLEAADDEAVLIDADGAPIDDVPGEQVYGVLNRSRTRSASGGLLAQLRDRRPLGRLENELVVGVSYDRSRTRFDSLSELGALTENRSVDGLGTIIRQADGSIAPVSLRATTAYTGLFAVERLSLTRALMVEGSVRWNRAAIQLLDRIGTALNGSHEFTRLNWGTQLEWQVSKHARLSGGFSSSNRAPTPAELSCADEQAPCSLTNFFVSDPPLDQVVAHSLEVRGSGGSEGFEWEVAAYRTVSDNDIQFVASGVRGRAFFRNVGSTRRQGLEASLSWTGDALSASVGYAYSDPTFRSSFSLNSPNNPGADGAGRILVRAGDRLPGVPDHRATLSADWKGRRWSLGADVQAASGQYLVGDEANLQARTRPYAVVNLRGSIRVQGQVSAFGDIRNLLNERYASFGTFGETDQVLLVEAPSASDPRSLGPGAPRRAILGVTVTF